MTLAHNKALLPFHDAAHETRLRDLGRASGLDPALLPPDLRASQSGNLTRQQCHDLNHRTLGLMVVLAHDQGMTPSDYLQAIAMLALKRPLAPN